MRQMRQCVGVLSAPFFWKLPDCLISYIKYQQVFIISVFNHFNHLYAAVIVGYTDC